MKKWHDYEENKIRGYWCKAPYDNIFIGCDPCDGMTLEFANKFTAFINVNDTPCNLFEPLSHQKVYWYPLNEMGYWGYAPFFWFKKIIEHYSFKHNCNIAKKPEIYVHCAAGAYRSPNMVYWWLRSLGHSHDECQDISYRGGSDRQGNIPKKLMEFYESMTKHPTWSLCGHYFSGIDDDIIENTPEIRGKHRRKSNFEWFFIRLRNKLRLFNHLSSYNPEKKDWDIVKELRLKRYIISKLKKQNKE